MEDVVFEHMHYVVGKSALDATYVKKNQRLDDLLFIALDEERAFAAKILARTIEGVVKEHFTGVERKHEVIAAGHVKPKSGFVARIKRMLLSM
jgi:hypothetical protein